MTEMHSAADTLLTGDMERLLGDEHAAINARRTFHGRKPIDPSFSHRATHTYDLRGVCLSGGGVRSATFCLGAMQALEQAVGFKCIDLLSTVSGGGYLGSSITAAMAVKPGFPYATPGDRSDMRPVGHLRDFSNYLIPRGENLAVPRGLAVVLRGLALNGVLTAAWMAMFAAVTALGLFGRSVAPPSCRGHSGLLVFCSAFPFSPRCCCWRSCLPFSLSGRCASHAPAWQAISAEAGHRWAPSACSLSPSSPGSIWSHCSSTAWCV
jgi:hypothetical protein